MRWLWPIVMLSVLAACDDDEVRMGRGPGNVSYSAGALGPVATTSASAPPAPSATGKTRCDELNEALWTAVREQPRACKTAKDCVIVGPGKCRVGKKWKSCVAGIKKGYEGPIDDLSKRWEAAGCEKGLEQTVGERLVCRAGVCAVLVDK